MPDHYETLGVPKSATAEDIKKAFREAAFKYHPDRNPGNPAAEERFKRVNEAYAILSDPASRARYDGLGGAAYGAGPGANGPWGDYGPFEGESRGRYTWTFYGPFGGMGSQGSGQGNFSRREALDLLTKGILTFAAGVLLFRVSFFFGIFGVIVCAVAIGRGLVDSLRAVRILFGARR